MKIIPIKCKGSRYVSWQDIKPFQGSLKTMNKEQAEKLKNSLIKRGWCFPVFVWRDGETNWTIDGHGRLLILAELMKEGYTIDNIPVVDIEAKDKKEAGEKLLLCNSRYQNITEDGLYEFMHNTGLRIDDLADIELPEIDLNEFEAGYFLEQGLTDPDEIPETPAEPITKRGDIYILGGKHRVMCGDSTKKEDVERLMDGKKADMVFTDPPYNIGFSYNNYNDKLAYENYKAFCKRFFELLDCNRIVITPGPRNLGIWHQIITNIKDIGWFQDINNEDEDIDSKTYDEGVWCKNNSRSGASCFHFRKCEPIILYGNFKKKRNYDLFTYARTIKRELTDAEKKGGIVKFAPAKPVLFIADIIKSFSEPKEIIKDVFLGSGSTLIASEMTGRICYGIELDERYCDVIVARYCNYTGNRQIIKNGEQITWNI